MNEAPPPELYPLLELTKSIQFQRLRAEAEQRAAEALRLQIQAQGPPQSPPQMIGTAHQPPLSPPQMIGTAYRPPTLPTIESQAQDFPVDYRGLSEFAARNGFVVTSTTGGKHNPGSAHALGLAIDVRTRDKTPYEIEQFIKAARAAGIRVLDERLRPPGQKEWSAPHLHLQVPGPKQQANQAHQTSQLQRDENQEVQRPVALHTGGSSYQGSVQGVASEAFATNLGIHYEKVPYANGTFGAKLTRHPVPGSPAAQLGLEPGDIIYTLDSMSFRKPSDVLNHTARTTMNLIDVRTGQHRFATVNLR